jgi:hypothetical protein
VILPPLAGQMLAKLIRKVYEVDPLLCPKCAGQMLVARGEVDASAGFELHKLTMIARGVKEEDIVAFRLADYGFNMYGNAILASAKLIAENPKAAPPSFARRIGR